MPHLLNDPRRRRFRISLSNATAPTTATARIAAAAFSRFIPPIATGGMAIARRTSASSLSPVTGPVSVFVAVGWIGPNPT